MTDPISPLLFADYSRPKEGVKKDRRDLRGKRKHERRGKSRHHGSESRFDDALRTKKERKTMEKKRGSTRARVMAHRESSSRKCLLLRTKAWTRLFLSSPRQEWRERGRRTRNSEGTTRRKSLSDSRRHFVEIRSALFKFPRWGRRVTRENDPQI